jgi:hypothetical protein
MPIACVAIAGLAAFAVARIRWRGAALAALVLLTLDLTFDVTAVEPTPADEANRAYAAARDARPGRLLELPVHPPDRQESSVYLYYAMQAPRERPAGYSTIAPERALQALHGMRPCPPEAKLDALGVQLVAVVGTWGCNPGRLLERDGAVAIYKR